MTDGCLGIGRGSLRHSLATHNQRSESNRFPLPFPFPSKLYIMCMANLEEVMPFTKFFSLIMQILGLGLFFSMFDYYFIACAIIL